MREGEKKEALVPAEFLTAQEVAAVCVAKFGNLEAFKDEVKKRKVAAKEKFEAKSKTDQPQKKRSKIERVFHFDGH